MNKYKILFSPGAILDMREARKWYNLQQKGLGKRFRNDLKKVVASIKLNPHFASVKFGDIRTAVCETFPYAVHYEIGEEEKLVRKQYGLLLK